MTQPLEQQQEYYIQATAEAPPEQPLVLKQDDVFAVFDRFGDIDSTQYPASGVYHGDTRFLCLSQLLFAGSRPLLLSSSVRRDNVVLAVDLTNPDLYSSDHKLFLARGSLHIYRSQFLWSGALYQRVQIKNFSLQAVRIQLDWNFGADFTDIFEVRGTSRLRHGNRNPPRRENDAVVIHYYGLDGLERRTVIRCPSDPPSLSVEGMHLVTWLEPGTAHSAEVIVAFEQGAQTVDSQKYESGLSRAANRFHDRGSACSVSTTNEQFNAWLERSEADLQMLCTQVQDGIYPYAGTPWFATPFGRDGIWTALECLWTNPAIARGVLRYLTRTQATEVSVEKDSEPGKIIHEAREGEMAALDEIPFGRYYGSVDSTPLYLLLAGAYFKRTGDWDLLEEIWDGIERALDWIDTTGDLDGDGFVEYYRKSKTGLLQQGWKDSVDSIFHRDGTLAEGPIALCEVQGYVYAAKAGLAEVAGMLSGESAAEKLRVEARQLQLRFEDAFWSPELGSYAMALDGEKRRCEVLSSNAGHALYCGIAHKDRAYVVANEFMTDRFYSGWGIRTIAEGESRYNPMSYHNGSVWPHDNAIISAGMSRFGFTELSARVMSGLFQAASSLELSRLPELFCGFRRRSGKMPTLYPTACSPQAWAAGAAFQLLRSCVGLSIDALKRKVILRHPILPDFLDTVYVRNLAVRGAVVDFRLFRSGNTVAVAVDRRVGDLDVLVLT